MIRRSFHESFGDWQRRANPAEVRVIADACRALRCFDPKAYGLQGHDSWNTEGTYMPPEKKNARNISEVPLGSLYAGPTTAGQKSFIKREATRTLLLDRARQIEESHKLGSSQGNLDISLTMPNEPPGAAMKGFQKAVPVMAHNRRSENKSAWTGDLHSKTQVDKYALNSIKLGETSWRECRHDSVYVGGDPFKGALESASKVRSFEAAATPLMLSQTRSMPTINFSASISRRAQ